MRAEIHSTGTYQSLHELRLTLNNNILIVKALPQSIAAYYNVNMTSIQRKLNKNATSRERDGNVTSRVTHDNRLEDEEERVRKTAGRLVLFVRRPSVLLEDVRVFGTHPLSRWLQPRASRCQHSEEKV